MTKLSQYLKVLKNFACFLNEMEHGGYDFDDVDLMTKMRKHSKLDLLTITSNK